LKEISPINKYVSNFESSSLTFFKFSVDTYFLNPMFGYDSKLKLKELLLFIAE